MVDKIPEINIEFQKSCSFNRWDEVIEDRKEKIREIIKVSFNI